MSEAYEEDFEKSSEKSEEPRGSREESHSREITGMVHLIRWSQKGTCNVPVGVGIVARPLQLVGLASAVACLVVSLFLVRPAAHSSVLAPSSDAPFVPSSVLAFVARRKPKTKLKQMDRSRWQPKSDLPSLGEGNSDFQTGRC